MEIMQMVYTGVVALFILLIIARVVQNEMNDRRREKETKGSESPEQ